FSSRAGLLDALYDHLAGRGNMHRMGTVFQEKNPSVALDKMVSTFVGFWASDPVVMRRLRAMAYLDREIGQGIQARDARRPQLVLEILRRAMPGKTKQLGRKQRAAADVLAMLTSFEAYDALSRAGHSEEQIMTTLT